jgi:hypothetical protein
MRFYTLHFPEKGDNYKVLTFTGLAHTDQYGHLFGLTASVHLDKNAQGKWQVEKVVINPQMRSEVANPLPKRVEYLVNGHWDGLPLRTAL